MSLAARLLHDPRLRAASNRALLAAKTALGRSRWAIAIYAGGDPLALAPPPGRAVPVLTRRSVTDAVATFVADPFMIRVDGGWHMFFEILACRRGATKGIVGHATSRDGFDWQYQRIVLEEPFHLSYPHVFAWGSDHYMIPESQRAGAVRLYRADPFPSRWRYVGDLLTGPTFFDSTVFRRDDRWWMLTETSGEDTLRLFQASDLTGPWREHPRSPIVSGDRHASRPAGPVVADGDRLLRFAQDCVPLYGTGVRAFEITKLTPDAYEERPAAAGPVLGPGARRWNSRGMHQLDAHRLDDGRWIACVDGWYRGLVAPAELRDKLAR